MPSHYNRTQLAQALRQVGLQRGDVVFSHSNIGYFGIPEEGYTPEAIFQTIFGAFQDVIGEEGTLVVPTFTYSFCKRQPFDPDQTPSTCGMFTEMLRLQPNAYRSHDPIFSVAAVGRQAEMLTEKVAIECFGKNSFWERFLQAEGVICNLNFDAGSTFIHYVERCLNVPYRYDKLFPGTFIEKGQSKKGSAIFFCQDLSNPSTVAAMEQFDSLARNRGMVQNASVGRGAIVCIRASDTYRLIEEQLKINPWLLTTSANAKVPPVLIRPSNTARFGLSLPETATMTQMIEALWQLPRDLLSDGYDAALEALAKQVPMTIHEYPTGTSCWTWIVPEKWTCHEAYLETLAGQKLFSYADHPLHVVSYSLPFEGEVSREELFKHLYTHPKLPDAIPYQFKFYERDWGLCCSQTLKDSLTEERYRVVIKTCFSYGTLKVGEVVVPGETADSIILCAHLDHPAQVNDDLTGVVVGIDVIRELLKRRPLRYTYRLLIVPETIGSLAYLSHHEELIPKQNNLPPPPNDVQYFPPNPVPKIVGGLFLEMLGLENPHALQLSFQGDTELDQCFKLALNRYDAKGWTDLFPKVIGNDERQFNSPGVRIPMLSLSRVERPVPPDYWPYPAYHSSSDTPALAPSQRLEESRELVLQMIETLENNWVPINKFKGEVFCSRYGIFVDFYTNPEGNMALFDVMYLIDGTRSLAEIALTLGISFQTVKQIVDLLKERELVE